MTTFLVLATALSARAEETGPCALAPGLREAVQLRFGSTRVLKVADLFEDERALFGADHPGACPGRTLGRFFRANERPAEALILLDVEPRKNIRLVVARPAMATWVFHEVDELDKGSTAVVSTKRPGTYVDAADAATKRSVTDVVALTGYESWQRVYIWNGRSFEKVKLTN